MADDLTPLDYAGPAAEDAVPASLPAADRADAALARTAKRWLVALLALLLAAACIVLVVRRPRPLPVTRPASWLRSLPSVPPYASVCLRGEQRKLPHGLEA